MSARLDGRHMFIAGGSRGIGAAAAREAAARGASVSITYRADADAATRVVDAIRTRGGSARAYQADVADEASIAAAVDAAARDLGPMRGVVVSAGVFEHQRIEDMSAAFWRRLMAINLDGTMWTVKATARHLRTAKVGGSIVIYTSTAGQSGGGDGASAYCVTKAGQITFARCMAHELAPDRVRVNTIAPAWTDTDMPAAILDRLGREQIARSFPLGRIGKAEDVATATCFLLSDDAAFITGTTVTVDGGIAMRG